MVLKIGPPGLEHSFELGRIRWTKAHEISVGTLQPRKGSITEIIERRAVCGARACGRSSHRRRYQFDHADRRLLQCMSQGDGVTMQRRLAGAVNGRENLRHKRPTRGHIYQ
jgi:hypothetical protein